MRAWTAATSALAVLTAPFAASRSCWAVLTFPPPSREPAGAVDVRSRRAEVVGELLELLLDPGIKLSRRRVAVAPGASVGADVAAFTACSGLSPAWLGR